MEKMSDILKKMIKSSDVVDAFVTPELIKDHLQHINVPGSKARRTFFKVYEGLIERLHELNGSELKVLLYLGFNMEYNKSRITMDKEFWQNITDYLGMSREYIRRVLTGLKEKGIIYDDRIYLYVGGLYISKRR